MKNVIVIPARQGSSRFPGKPMAMICGSSLLHRVWKIAKAVQGVDQVFVATDHPEVERHAREWGAEVVQSRMHCTNGTERVYDALKCLQIQPEIVINLQGDAVLTPPWIIQSVLDEMQRNSELPLATPAVRWGWEQYDEYMKTRDASKAGGTFVVVNRFYDALYFSKTMIPFVRATGQERPIAEPPIYRHIGLYAYRYSALAKYVNLPPSPLEELEKLEQLRALENAMPIRVVPVDYKGRTHGSIDNPEDIQKVEEIIRREGELVQ